MPELHSPRVSDTKVACPDSKLAPHRSADVCFFFVVVPLLELTPSRGQIKRAPTNSWVCRLEIRCATTRGMSLMHSSPFLFWQCGGYLLLWLFEHSAAWKVPNGRHRVYLKQFGYFSGVLRAIDTAFPCGSTGPLSFLVSGGQRITWRVFLTPRFRKTSPE